MRLICALSLAAVSSALAGPLTPPAGPVSSTYRTLDEVEARTPLGSAFGAITITEPGSYYLTEPHNTFGDGIRVQASGVTIDLNGFAITGDGDAADRAIIYDRADGTPLVIRNGFISNFGSNGVDVTNLIAENIELSGCRIGFDVSNDATIIRCTARDCTLDGFFIHGRASLVSCTASGNTADGFDFDAGTAIDCVATDNGSSGFFTGIAGDHQSASLTGCESIGNAIGFRADGPCALTRCLAESNSGPGYDLRSARVAHCTANENVGVGFDSKVRPSVYEGCLASGNFNHGFSVGPGAVVSGCASYDNSGNGFVGQMTCAYENCVAGSNSQNGFVTGAGSSIMGCVSNSNTQDGYDLDFDCQISFSTADANGTIGIRGGSDCTIDSNLVTDHPTGIVGGTGSLVIRNRAAGNTTANYDLTGSSAGPVSSDPASATNPWTNFGY